jgi:citrate lyase subunit beta/citryl-CoA lyase
VIPPEQALFDGHRSGPPLIPACDHYAGTERRMQKALALQAELGPIFDVTLDLEDGAPTGSELEAARAVAALLAGPENVHGRAGVRIHDGGHPHWQADVDIVLDAAADRVSHITIPKVISAHQAAEMITYIRTRAASARQQIPIHVLIETWSAVNDAFKIASLPWMVGLDFGHMDFISSHHGAIPAAAMRSPLQFDHAIVRHAKTMVAAAALSHGLVPAHNVTIDVDDPAQAERDARRARAEFGFLRMWSIHPAQIEPILAAFAPDRDEVREASTVMLAGGAADWAPIRHDGRLFDRASYRYYWQVLRRAHADGVALPTAAATAFFDGAASGSSSR